MVSEKQIVEYLRTLNKGGKSEKHDADVRLAAEAAGYVGAGVWRTCITIRGRELLEKFEQTDKEKAKLASEGATYVEGIRAARKYLHFIGNDAAANDLLELEQDAERIQKEAT